MTDLLVIGGGAAGLMAAGAACAKGLTVTVLEHNPKGPGQKLLITGKGRCNVTSDSDVREFLPYVRHNGRFLYSSLYAFPPASAMQLFEELGVPLKTERGRRVFPQSDRAADVLAALRDYARDAEFVRGSAKKLLLEDGVCKGAVTDRGETLRAENTLIATGGISYPATGSDGSGYKLARQAGHTIVTPQPSLCSLISPDPACRRMMGLALRNVRLTLLCDGKELFTEQGEALFTHFGLSGPLVLSASTYIEDIAKHRYICEFDLKPALDEKTLYDRLTRDFAEQGAHSVQGALAKLLPMQQGDFEGIYEAMEGCPVTIRFLDPPLHEFVPTEEADIEKLASDMGKTVAEIKNIIAGLHEFNPMMGHRGCRLAVTYPEIAAMQTRAVIKAALNVSAETGHVITPHIMIPLVGEVKELKFVKDVVVKVADELIAAAGVEMKYQVGTMIEIPRAALTAGEIAKEAEFFSFGTNDLTQMTFGFSRDDAAKFLGAYYENKIYESDPFQHLDQIGVGKLVKMAAHDGRETRPDLGLGICGEHGGDPTSVEFCHNVGLDYVSCSPFRVPIARLAAAQAAIKNPRK